MKLLVVLSVKEYQRKVTTLLEESGVNRFSVADIAGHKKKKGSISWFASHPDSEKTDSILLFSFTDEEIANQALNKINECNAEMQNPFPVHAFVMNVENFSNLI
ncbi:MAG: hypothetical protein H6Q14_2477 [Bacteroidetes bacterium]|jgi:nitrogen regulatory protein PII|nr:hypothetical protein [Bacteroidota bacterium]